MPYLLLKEKKRKMKFEYNFVRKGVFDLPETDWWGFDPEDHIEIQEHWTMAHLAVEMGLFPSVGQARKNGWDGPIPHGYTEKKNLGKMKKSMYIHNPSNQFISDPNWGKEET